MPWQPCTQGLSPSKPRQIRRESPGNPRSQGIAGDERRCKTAWSHQFLSQQWKVSFTTTLAGVGYAAVAGTVLLVLRFNGPSPRCFLRAWDRGRFELLLAVLLLLLLGLYCSRCDCTTTTTSTYSATPQYPFRILTRPLPCPCCDCCSINSAAASIVHSVALTTLHKAKPLQSIYRYDSCYC